MKIYLKNHIFLIVNIVYLVITSIICIYGYFNLPDKVATQIGLSGELDNQMSTPIYLIFAFILILLLSVLSLTQKEKAQKIKSFVACTICFIANIAMIVTQL